MLSGFSIADIDVGLFPMSYAEARENWLKVAATLSCPTEHLDFPYAGKGPEGEGLITDSLWLGKQEADNVLIIIAGTHGVEGFAGSAVELDLLGLIAAGKLPIPENTAILLVHALTPWGYAWLRRCDADGVDLNRNAVDFSQALPENPDYLVLREVLYLSDTEHRQAELLAFGRKFGRIALEKAVSGGQYCDPQGPFYGGRTPVHGRLVCEELMRRYSLSKRRLAVIDVHTGLGPYGYGEIICDHAPESPGTSVARHWYGDSVTLPLAGTSSSVPKLGLMDYAWHAVMNQFSAFVTLEFGTFGTEQLFETLLRDHQLWAQGNNANERRAHGGLMKKHFCPEEIAWREMVLFRARQVSIQGLRGVSQ